MMERVIKVDKALTLSPGRRILVLYILLGAGGLWHLLGVFGTTMRVLAGPLIIFMGVWIGWEYRAQVSAGNRTRLYLWMVGVVVGTFLLEWIGIATGVIFGSYRYEDTLQPQVFMVPVAIGFAWLTVLLGAQTLARLVLGRFRFWISLLLPVVGGFFMVGFDFLLEPAAQQLGYWSWSGGAVPVRNYLVWFFAGVIILTIGQMAQVFPQRPVRFAGHTYIAQVMYFGLALM